MLLVAVSLPAATLRLLRVSREKFEISELDLQLCPQVKLTHISTRRFLSFLPFFFQLRSNFKVNGMPANALQAGMLPIWSQDSRLDQVLGVMKGFIREILPLKMALIN